MVLHKKLAAGDWQKLCILEQMGNIGSEVGRAVNSNDPKIRKVAAIRALELFDMTLEDSRWRGRGSEIARSREVFCDYIFGDNRHSSTAENLEKYFMNFALAARLNR